MWMAGVRTTAHRGLWQSQWRRPGGCARSLFQRRPRCRGCSSRTLAPTGRRSPAQVERSQHFACGRESGRHVTCAHLGAGGDHVVGVHRLDGAAHVLDPALRCNQVSLWDGTHQPAQRTCNVSPDMSCGSRASLISSQAKTVPSSLYKVPVRLLFRCISTSTYCRYNCLHVADEKKAALVGEHG